MRRPHPPRVDCPPVGISSRIQSHLGDLLSETEAYSRSPTVFTHSSLQTADPGDLLGRLLSAVEKTPQYDAGAYRFGRAVEVLEAKRSAERRALLEERYRKACGEVGAEPLSDAEWRSLWARRMLFLQDFERDDDWSGKIIEEEEGRHLQGATDNRWFGRFIRVGVNYDHARAAAQTWIRFRYRVARPGPIQVMLFDLTQKDNYRYRIEPSVVGAWTEVELDVTGAFTRADGSLSRMAAGDAIDDIHLAHVACRVRRRHEFRGPDHVRTRLDDETDERE